MRPDGGVLFVHAHPDDESTGTGGTIARLVSEGVRVDLVTCTDGAEGEIHDPALDQEEARPRLAEIRREELACSLGALGGDAIRLHLLGYRDSGMMGTESNEHADAFWRTDLAEATRRLSAIISEARPAAIVTYDENGNYGHPDHINASRIARDAYLASLDEPWVVSRFYELAFDRDHWAGLMADMKERGIAIPWERDMDGSEEAPAEEDPFGTPDELVTTRVDVSAHLDAKRRSMACHKTQRQDFGWLLDLPADLAERALATEFYVLRWRDGENVASSHREAWLLGA